MNLGDKKSCLLARGFAEQAARLRSGFAGTEPRRAVFTRAREQCGEALLHELLARG